LLNYNIHFGFTANSVRHNDVETVRILSQKVSVIFHKDHPFTHLDTVDIKDVGGQTLIQSIPGYQLYNITKEKMDLNDVVIANTISVETLESTLEMIRHNLGVALIPSSYTQNLIDPNINILHLHEENNSDININLIYNK